MRRNYNFRRNSDFVGRLLSDLNRTSRYLNEAYVFDNEDGGPEGRGMYDEYDDEGYGDEGYDEMGPRGPQMGGPEQMPQQMHHDDGGGDGDNAEEQAMHAQEVIKHEPIIGKIRETAIEGLKKYADNPTSDLYGFFKKVFLESDKVLTDTGKNK